MSGELSPASPTQQCLRLVSTRSYIPNLYHELALIIDHFLAATPPAPSTKDIHLGVAIIHTTAAVFEFAIVLDEADAEGPSPFYHPRRPSTVFALSTNDHGPRKVQARPCLLRNFHKGADGSTWQESEVKSYHDFPLGVVLGVLHITSYSKHGGTAIANIAFLLTTLMDASFVDPEGSSIHWVSAVLARLKLPIINCGKPVQSSYILEDVDEKTVEYMAVRFAHLSWLARRLRDYEPPKDRQAAIFHSFVDATDGDPKKRPLFVYPKTSLAERLHIWGIQVY